MCSIDSIEKDLTVGEGKNSYKAVSESEILNKVKPLFREHKLIIFPVSGDMKDNAIPYVKTDKFKKIEENTIRAITELKAVYRIVDIESGEYQDVVGFGNGADSQDKGAGKAFTYSFKNALCKSFMMFSGEDTDNTHSDDIGKEKQYSKPVENKPTEKGPGPIKNVEDMLTLTFKSGEHEGKTYLEVAREDPDYLQKLIDWDKTKPEKNISTNRF